MRHCWTAPPGCRNLRARKTQPHLLEGSEKHYPLVMGPGQGTSDGVEVASLPSASNPEASFAKRSCRKVDHFQLSEVPLEQQLVAGIAFKPEVPTGSTTESVIR